MALRRRGTDDQTGEKAGASGAPATPQRFEYATETVRSKLIGDRMDHEALAKVLNDWASRGWQLRTATETEVKGRVGPGGTMGMLLIFERPVTSAA